MPVRLGFPLLIHRTNKGQAGTAPNVDVPSLFSLRSRQQPPDFFGNPVSALLAQSQGRGYGRAPVVSHRNPQVELRRVGVEARGIRLAAAVEVRVGGIPAPTGTGHGATELTFRDSTECPANNNG